MDVFGRHCHTHGVTPFNAGLAAQDHFERCVGHHMAVQDAVGTELLDLGDLQLQVTQVEQLGANSILHGHVVPDAPFEVILSGQTSIQRGDTVRVAVPPEHIHCYDKDGLRI